MWLLQTTSNIEILYTIGNYFSSWLRIWDHYFKIRLGLSWINVKVSPFYTEIYAIDLGTFVVNGGYHLKEQVVLNTMTPRIAVKNGHWPAFEYHIRRGPSCASTVANGSISQQNELAPAPLVCSSLQALAYAHQWCLGSPDRITVAIDEKAEREIGKCWERERDKER